MTVRPNAESETISDALYRQLKSDIVFARLAPGQKLRLDSVGQTYGVSASTLREILHRLCSDGFVAAEGQRGFEVAPVSATGFREVAAMRLLLECAALEASFAAGDLEWEGAVVAAHYKLARLEDEVAAGDWFGGRALEKLRPRVSPVSRLRLRIGSAARDPCVGLRQISQIPDGV